MRDVCRHVVIALGAFVIGCGSGGGNGDADGGNGDGVDASMIAPDRCDQSGGPICDNDEVCFEGACAADACLTEANTCADGETCDMECVVVSDPCESVDCDAGFTCYEGSCVAGCFPPSPCLGVTCEDGQYCDGGSCFDLNACEGECPDGFACNTVCRPISPCIDIECEEDEVCVAGECRTNPCFGVECETGAICVNGTCINTCEGCDCEPFEECIFGDCVCVPNCEGKTCGDDDGCGGKCDSCPTAGNVCDTDTSVCSCNPSCSGRDCGELNQCGDACVTNNGCNGGVCDATNPSAPACMCPAGREVCEDGDCCAEGRTCIDSNNTPGTDRCCQPDRVCDQNPSGNDQCCGGSQTCVTGTGCCNNNDTCEDTGGNCLCGGSEIAINCSNGTVGDEFCCRNNARACEQADAAVACCPSGFTCFDSNDAGTEHDTCCTESSWCGDSQACCNVAAGEVCYNDDDNDPENDTCCAPDCEGKACGADDGCGGLCIEQTCGPGQTCTQIEPGNVSCENDNCDPQCNPCTEICIAGSCEPKCSDGEEVNPTTCECEGNIIQ